MSRKAIVVGLGEVGGALYRVLKKSYGENVAGYDLSNGPAPEEQFEVLNICFPYSDGFLSAVRSYAMKFRSSLIIIHSTVPVGTTSKIGPDAVHSPILGDHTNMEESQTVFMKWIGGSEGQAASAFLTYAGFACALVEKPEETELLKLFCLAKYGLAVAFSKYEKEVFDKFGLDPKRIEAWDGYYNQGLNKLGKSHLERPVIRHEEGPIGGHCVIPGARLLSKTHPDKLLGAILEYGPDRQDAVVWQPSNVYPTARIGKNVSIGTFCEIGHEVWIGDNVRIGAMCFIPEMVTIEDDAWIGPRVTFTNDMFPPSGREHWQHTTVKRGARIGAAVTIRPGVTIGEGALVGAGAVVTHDVPPNELWVGIPARKIERVKENV